MEKIYFIIDFDSTLVEVESLDELALISLEKDPKREEIAAKIKEITSLGMEGVIPIDESLDKRISLLKANKHHIEELIKKLEGRITPSFLRNRDFLSEHPDSAFIISSGFKEFIVPIAKKLNFPEKNIFANTFVFDGKGEIIGLDKSNPLSQKNGKVNQLASLNLKGEIYAIGDGFTDYELKEKGSATKFFAFTENVKRDSAMKNADHAVSSFDEVIQISGSALETSHQKEKLKVLLLENVHPRAVSMLNENGYLVESSPKSLSEEELCSKVKGVAMLGIRSKTQITKKVVDCADSLMVIGAFCVGTNQIDVSACTDNGIVIFNAPYSNTRSVVELAMGEMIMLMRNVFDRSVQLHQGVWSKSSAGSHEIRGKKLGIIGYGNIGTQLSVLAESFGMEVYYYDTAEKLSIGNAKRCHAIHELLKKCDVISMHVDGGSGNKNLISDEELSMMKPKAILLNLSRGSTVDLEALVRHIKSGKIGGAGIDVFPNEPQGSEEFISSLRGLPNVIITPHIGGSTEEAQQNIAEFVGQKIMDFIANGNTSNSINFPNISLPKVKSAHRLVHVHRNVPGVLSQINSAIAGNHVNIEGQYLKTNEKIGYVITDVSKEYDKKILNEMKNVDHTIKFRVLS